MMSIFVLTVSLLLEAEAVVVVWEHEAPRSLRNFPVFHPNQAFEPHRVRAIFLFRYS
jgi:hypothetical protein